MPLNKSTGSRSRLLCCVWWAGLCRRVVAVFRWERTSGGFLSAWELEEARRRWSAGVEATKIVEPPPSSKNQPGRGRLLRFVYDQSAVVGRKSYDEKATDLYDIKGDDNKKHSSGRSRKHTLACDRCGRPPSSCNRLTRSCATH